MNRFRLQLSIIVMIIVQSLHSANAANIDAWPLLEITEDSTTICYPLFVKEKNFQMIFPIYFKTNKGKDYHFCWPLLKISEKRLERALPFWYTESDSFTLFPFIRQTPEYTFWSVPPMYFDKKGRFTAIIPFYITNNNKRFIFPNIYYKKENNNITHFKLFPFVDYVNTKNVSSINYCYLWGNKQKKNYLSKWFLPFYYSLKKENLENFWALPYFYQKTPNQVSHHIVPVYQRTDGHLHQSFRLFNYYQASGAKFAISGFFPIYHVQQSKLSNNRTKSVEYLFLFVYKKETITSESEELLERKRRFLFFSDELKSDGTRLFKIFDKLVSERVVDKE